MNSKSIWFWSITSVLLLALVAAHHFLAPAPVSGPPRVLPRFDGQAVNSVHVRPKGQLEIRAERSGARWMLVAPVNYPAQGVIIDQLLASLEKITPAATISAAELKQNPDAKERYGFAEPQASVVLAQGDNRVQLLLGALTAPGDQVFLQVVGIEEIFVVDSGILAFLPKELNDWRDTAFIRLKDLQFNQLSVTNGSRFFTLQRPSEKDPWRMSTPIDARADNARVTELLQLLDSLRVVRFAYDGPMADLSAFGLQRPELQIGLRQGSNTVALLQFGESPTNAADQVYARWDGTDSVVTVPRPALAPWRLSVNEIRDPHLISDPSPVDLISIEGPEAFSIERLTNGWRVLPENLEADPGLVQNLLVALARMTIVEFTKDIVTTNDWSSFGLAEPVLRYSLLSVLPGQVPTNRVIVRLDFGTNTNDRIFVRRTDEPSVYAVTIKDFLRLPIRGFQLRHRQLWNFSEDEIKGVTIRQQGRVRQLERRAAHDWALAPGSQGIINELAIEETVRPLCSLAAERWVDRGKDVREFYGLGEQGHQVDLELKDGTKRTLHIGNAAPGQPAFGGVSLGEEFWVFEFPSSLYRFVTTYLSVPVLQ